MKRARPLFLLGLGALAGAAAWTGAPHAQVDRQGGTAPINSSGSFEVSGVRVDTRGATAEAARLAGWRLAQRRGWQMLSQRLTGNAQTLPDGALDALVSGIVVESEQIGPNRYIARLGVLFQRGRAAGILGVAGVGERSPAMLVLPLSWSGGVGTAFERATPWQAAWSRFRTGNTVIDYVRLAGSGPDSLLFNAGQATRRSRGWWRTVLGQYGAVDVLIPQVRLFRQWPGGPVLGEFTAGHGPDNRQIARFTLRVASDDAIPALLDEGVRRIDRAYSDALRGGELTPDIALISPPPGTPAPVPTPTPTPTGTPPASEAAAPSTQSVLLVQVDTPSATALSGAEASLRGIPGVSAAATTSLALGGVSVMRVVYDGDPALLRTALESRGWRVEGDGTTLRIRRAPPPPAPPAPPPEE
mgnify:CR=1 FL=1